VSFAKKDIEYILHPTHSRTTGIVTTLILVFVVFLTVAAAQQPQTLKQWAMGKYVQCGENLNCEATAVEKSCPREETKCLAAGTNYYGADTVNGQSLVCCKAKRYSVTNNACTLVKEGPFANPSCTN
jgi:hypothetical protein